MREIKFRAWQKEEKVMCPVSTINISEGAFCIGAKRTDDTLIKGTRTLVLASTDGRFCKWEEIEFMQYAGLNDKNGKEIYEGDVVLHFGGGRWRVITYKHCGFISMRGELEIEIPKRSEDVEVIGNIHENPELVKEKTNAVNP